MSISKGKKKTNLDLNLTPYTKLTQNVKLGEKLQDLQLGEQSLDMTQNAWFIKEKYR